MNYPELVGPPSYEYETTSPWWIVHTRDGTNQGWLMHTLESAVTRFWLFDAANLSNPVRRIIVDGYGVTIMGIDNTDPVLPRMCGTRQAMELTLGMVRRSGNSTEDQVHILTMIDTVQRMDGQPLL